MDDSKHAMGTNGVNGLHTIPNRPSNAWQIPGPAAFDFRSDVVTTPTASMLAAIQNTTLLDDVFAEDPTTNALETYLAQLTGFPAALLVLSGTMGNQVAIRTHLTQPPHSVLCDHRAHILEWEAGGVASLCGALVRGIVPCDGHSLRLHDVQRHAVLDDDVHHAPTRLIALENTLGGEILPLADCQAISAFARHHGIKVHLDGARLWEAVAAQVSRGEHDGDLVQGLKAYCACVDSVSLCFSKGLGAPIGSMILGSPAFVKTARHIRKSIGGGLRQAGIVTAAARVAVDETFLGGQLEGSQMRARQLGEMWVSKGGKLAQRTETNMCWLDLEAAGVGVQEFVALGVQEGLRFLGGRLVVHYQIGEEAVTRLGRVMDTVLGRQGERGKEKGQVSPEVESEAEKVRRVQVE